MTEEKAYFFSIKILRENPERAGEKFSGKQHPGERARQKLV
jgi:hypothetical protein